MESLDIRGDFWPPTEPDQRVSGHLTFDPIEGGRLDLIGSFGDPYRSSSPDISRLVGIVGSKYYTLDNCFTTSHRLAPGGVDSQTIRVGQIIVGAKYGADERFQYDDLCLYLTNLLHWVERSGIEQSTEFNEQHRFGKHTVTGQMLDPIVVELPDGKLSLCHTLWEAGSSGEVALKQNFYFRLEFNRVLPLADVTDIASDLQDLVSIATCRTSGFEKIRLGGPNLVTETFDGTRYRERVGLLAPWHAQPEKSKREISSYDMAFTFEELGGMEGVKKWLAVAEQYRSMLGHVMNTRYARKMFSDDRFLHRIAPLESLHRAWKGTKNTPLRTRLTQLAGLAGSPFEQLVPDVEAWVDRVRDERDNIAHHYGRPLHQNPGELYYSAEAIYWLFVLCMLRLASAPDLVFSHIQQNPDFLFTAEQVASGP